ncbi:L-lactate permease [Sphingomonas naphthae]|uniref:L-lactate permease n=1 Tax=Sphingomonas naphthae TaxID=1813468 RepID=A0ABY7TP24_9SPHN|nr:L-lactate permease [Sphingomonas naphthae]WCT74140.1 L-lactate permease [Sphingomonas naphthae]
MTWTQNYDPFGSVLISTCFAAIPVVVLLGGLGLLHMRAHMAALAGLVSAFIVAVFAFGMPGGIALRAAGYGAAYGLMPIGWIILNIIFLYQMTNEHGLFDVLRRSISGVTADSRLQLLLIAFCFGAFFEGAAGFGAPVAVTGAMLIGLGFTRLQASGLSLIANTAPVAFGALGTPIVTLAAVTGLPLDELSAMCGRITFPFAMIVPAWLLVAYCGWRRTLEVWPAVLVVGVTFAVAQLLMSNLHGPWLTAIVAAMASIAALLVLIRIWSPARVMAVNEAPLAKGDERVPVADSEGEADHAVVKTHEPIDPKALRRAWMPWIILTVLVFVWGIPAVKTGLDAIFRLQLPFGGLDGVILRVPPVVAEPEAEKAIFNFNPLSTTGTSILMAALLSGLLLGIRPAAIARTYVRTITLVWPSLLTIGAMLALGYLTRFAGTDATMGLAFAMTGAFYPFFGTMLGWLGVAVTGSDTASNVLFGGLQKVTAQQLSLPPVLMAGANSVGGVMGKMVDAQSIVVASTATQWVGGESRLLRYVFGHSIVLAMLVGVSILIYAYVPVFTALIP